MASPDETELYGLDPEFERSVVFLAASSPSFYGRIGKDLDPEALRKGPARYAMEAIKSIASEIGRGPSRPLLVIQHLTRWRREGTRTHEQVLGVHRYFNDAEDFGLPDEDNAVRELQAIIRRRMQNEIVHHAMEEYAKRGDFSRIKEEIDKAQRLGEVDSSPGIVMGASSFAHIEYLRNTDRLPFGILEVDMEIGGGILRGTETVIIGPTKAGKSMSLTQVCANGFLLGWNVYLATLELPLAYQLARLKSNLTGVDIDAIMNGSMDIAKERLQDLMEMDMGTIEIKDFTARATTVKEILTWVEDSEKQSGRKCDVLVIDYPGLLTTEKEKRTYDAMKEIHTLLFNWAKTRHNWVVGAEQPQRASRGRRKIGTDDVADSINTVRIADLIISLNPEEDGESIMWHIAGSRYCPTGGEVGPLPHNFACARIGPLDREEPW